MGFILDGLSQVDVETRESEVVQLRGERGRGVSSSLSEDDAKAARWAAKAIRTIESVKTVVLYHDGKTILREGVLGSSRDVDAGSPTFSAAYTRPSRRTRPIYKPCRRASILGVCPKTPKPRSSSPFPMVVWSSRATGKAHCRRATWRRYGSSRGGSGSGSRNGMVLYVRRVDGVRAGMQPFLVCADRGSPRAPGRRAAALISGRLAQVKIIDRLRLAAHC